jgi:hypothetical protein
LLYLHLAPTAAEHLTVYKELHPSSNNPLLHELIFLTDSVGHYRFGEVPYGYFVLKIKQRPTAHMIQTTVLVIDNDNGCIYNIKIHNVFIYKKLTKVEA